MADSLIGAWQIDSGRSILSTGSPRTQTRRYEVVGNGHKVSVEGTNAQGERFSWHYTADYDGRPQPVHGWPQVDTVEARRIDENTTEGIFRKRGTIVAGYRRGVAADGLTIITAGADNGQGQPYFDVAVFRKTDQR